MKSAVTLLLTLMLCCQVACFASCSQEPSVSLGAVVFDFRGLVIERFPMMGRGRFSVGVDDFEYKWKQSTLTITRNGDGTFAITSPSVNGYIVEDDEHVIFDDLGHPSIRVD